MAKSFMKVNDQETFFKSMGDERFTPLHVGGHKDSSTVNKSL